MNNRYSIGIDFGTLSARAVLLDITSGEEICTALSEYRHGVMDRYLAYNGEKLPPDFALQDPSDYIVSLKAVVSDILRDSGVVSTDIVGIGVDFTCSTVLPVYKDGTPLCFDKRFASNAHAYVKLWKHHAAKRYADKLNSVASPELLKYYGGKISCEAMIPKIYEVLECAPEIYEAADHFMEAGEWITMYLTGKYTKSLSLAEAKALYIYENGYPQKEFFASFDKRLENIVEEKLAAPIVQQGEYIGNICKKAALELGLSEKTVVSPAMPDAHVATASLGMNRSGDICAILGTSACYMLISNKEVFVNGVCGIHKNSMTPGFYGYEAGLCCVGDMFSWLVNNITPASYYEEAKRENITIESYLTKKVSHKSPGESGLMVLNWWNGNRSILEDPDLSGTVIGLTLQSTVEDIFMAMMESTAYATRLIIENFKDNGIDINRFFAAGGIALKNDLMLQIFSDVLGMEISVNRFAQLPAIGSAIYAASAAGYDLNVFIERMGKKATRIFTPNTSKKAVYDRLYSEYKEMYLYFGKECNIMKKLRERRY